MRNAETVLGIIQQRGRHQLPLEDIYRQLFNPDLYLRARMFLRQNQGKVAPGVSGETMDSLKPARTSVAKLIEQLRCESYQWVRVKTAYTPLKNPKPRPPAGLPPWPDQLLEEVIRTMLEAYYQPQSGVHAHGFRPHSGCHTALQEITAAWSGTVWFIKASLAPLFGRLDFEVLLQILGEKLHDNRFLRLVANWLKSRQRYMENANPKQLRTLSETYQGSDLSQVLSSIYLDRLDRYVEKVLIPESTRGHKPGQNKPHGGQNARITSPRQKEKPEAAERRMKQPFQKTVSAASGDFFDPDYTRLRYVRYGGEVLFGFIGSKQEAEAVKVKLADFLKTTLKLELYADQTLITHASTRPVRFLGYDITVRRNNNRHDQHGPDHPATSGRICLLVPTELLEGSCRRYMRLGKPGHRSDLCRLDDFNIVRRYGAEYRGIVQYYRFAQNVSRLWRLHRVMKTSLLRTLAAKYKSTLKQMARQYTATISTGLGTLECVQARVRVEGGGKGEGEGEGKKPVVARFGGLHLRPQRL